MFYIVGFTLQFMSLATELIHQVFAYLLSQNVCSLCFVACINSIVS